MESRTRCVRPCDACVQTQLLFMEIDTVSNNKSLNAIQFRCYINGTEQLCFLDEAKVKLKSSHIGYLVPLGFYRYRIDGFEDAFFFPQRKILRAETEFAFELHRRRCSPLTLDDLHCVHDDGERFQPNTLNARAARFFRAAFANMPQERRPYEVNSVPGPGHKMQSGYLLSAGVSCCMIVDQVWSGPVRPYFDWSQFLDPPTRDQLRPSA